MDIEHKNIIQSNTLNIINNVDLGPLISVLNASKILCPFMVERIMLPTLPPFLQKLRFIFEIQKRGPTAFQAFVDALIATKQYKLAYDLGQNLTAPRQNNHSIVPLLNGINKISINYKFPMIEEDHNIIMDIDIKTSLIKPDHDYYFMEESRKGLALIINNETFEPNSKLIQRKGTSYDCTNLQNLYVKLGYKVFVKCNLTKAEMKDVLFEFSNRKDHGSSCLINILSHGKQDKIYGVDGQLLSLEYIAAMFDGKVCPMLLGRPKIFILQACRGDERDKGFFHQIHGHNNINCKDSLDATDSKKCFLPDMEAGDQKGIIDIIKYPTGMDMLFAYATLPGFVSWRNEMLGTWFIRTYVRCVAEYGHMYDILGLLTRVNAVIGHSYESRSGHKMLCEFTSRLSKKFYYHAPMSD